MDQFIAAFRDAVQNNYANFEGRLDLGGFWRFVAVNFVIGVVLSILGQVSLIFFLVWVVYALALLLPGLGAAVRRLHDTGRSGWFVLLALIPFVGAIILIVLCAQQGEDGVNDYGPPPAPITA